MTTPTTNITFSSIQTEFGGANPVSVSEYVRGGIYVDSAQTTSATDGTPIPTSTASAIRIGMFRGLTKTVAATFSIGGSMSSSNFGTAAATATVTLQTDGTITGSTSNGNLGTNNGALGDYYYSPTTAGIGNSRWMRYTLTTGQTPNIGSLVAGTWYQLSTPRSIGYNSGTAGAFSSRSGTVLIEISATSGGAVIASGSYSFQVDRES